MSRLFVRAHSAMRKTYQAVLEHLERRCLLSGSAQFTDTDGDIVTATVTGAGTVQIFQDTRNVWVSGSNASSVVNISVQKSPTGDGIATMGELRSFGPLASVNAPTINFTHEVTTDDSNLPVAATDKVSMNLGQLINLGLWTGGQRIGTLTVADWTNTDTGQQLNAPSIDTFIVTGRPAIGNNPALPGNSDEAMYLGDNTTSPLDYSIGYMNVAGRVGDIQATGQVGAIVAGAFDGQISANTIGRLRAMAGASPTADGSLHGSITANSIAVVRARYVATETISTAAGGITKIWMRTTANGLTVDSAGDIQTILIGNELSSSRIQAAGSIGTVSLGAVADTTFQAGIATSFGGIATSGSDFSNPSATVGSYTVTGDGAPNQPMITGSNTISAPNIGSLVLTNPDSSAAIQIYVVNRASPTTVDVTGQLDPAADFVWHDGQTEPQLLAAMLNYV